MVNKNENVLPGQEDRVTRYVMNALNYLDEATMHKGGASVRELSRVLQRKYRLPENYKKHLPTALKFGVAFGAIGKNGVKYFVEDESPHFREHRRRRRRGRRGRKGRGRRRRSRSRRRSATE